MGTDLKMSTRSAVERYSGALLDLSHSIHAEPELAFEEHRSVEKITSLLAREGFKIDRGVADLAQITLMSDGVSVYECTSADEVIDLLQGGQGVFGIALGRVWREVEGSLAELPGERAAGADTGPADHPADELAQRRRARKIG